MMMKREGRIYRRCGCADPATGRPIGAGCPRLAQRGHGSWYVTLELPPDPDGRRRRVRCGGYPARHAARQALAQLSTPGPAGATAITTGQWLGRRLACRTSPASSTVRGYAAHVRLYLQPHLGPILLAELTTAHVQAMFTAIIRQHQATGRPVNPATLARIRATLRAALNTAIRHGLITGNPARHVELPPARRLHAVVWAASRVAHWRATGERPPVAVWAAQTAQFLHAIRGDRLYAAFHLIALRGLRRGEAAGLRCCDLDLDDGVAVITQQLQQYDGHMVTCPPKTSHSARVIALDHTTVAALRHHRLRQHAEQQEPGHHDSGYVFTGLGGDPLAPDRLTRHFRTLTQAAGLPPIRLHDLRHGAATLALAAGVELKVVQDMMGHASIVLTADTYTSVLPEVARTAAEQVATLILKAGRLIPGTTHIRCPSSRRRKRQAHDAAPARLTAAHPARQITRPRRPGTSPA
jgi:integrase